MNSVKLRNYCLVYLIVILLILLIGCRTSAPKEKKEAQISILTKSYSPKTGEIFYSVLRRAEISDEIANKIIALMQNSGFKFSTLNTSDTFTVFYKNDTLFRLQYKKNFSTIYLFDNLQSDNITVEMCFKTIENKQQVVVGEINSSLYESMLAIGESPKLIANYADILAWDIDFFTETQNGDSFFVYLEKKYCDSVCVDYGRIYAVRYKGKIGDFAGYFYVDPKGNRDYYDSQGKSMRKAFLKSPLRYSYISSYFSSGRYHPILKIVRPHRGIDYVAPSGTPVSAIGDGTITFVGWKGGYGKFVEISHSQRFKSRYGHLRGFGPGIKSGRRVSQGQIVGYVGTTGLSTGPHLHFELLQNGSWVNPLKIIPPRADPVKPEYFSEFAKHRDSLSKFLFRQ